MFIKQNQENMHLYLTVSQCYFSIIGGGGEVAAGGGGGNCGILPNSEGVF